MASPLLTGHLASAASGLLASIALLCHYFVQSSTKILAHHGSDISSGPAKIGPVHIRLRVLAA
jgi:hypothetical protein